MMGRWSVWTGQRGGLMLHEMNDDAESPQRHTLSGRVQLPVLRASRVGVLRGSAISSRILTMRPSRGLRRRPWLVRWEPGEVGGCKEPVQQYKY